MVASISSMPPKDYVVCPSWHSNSERSSGGKRYKAVRSKCSRCGADVAVMVDIWKALGFDKDRVICEQCLQFLESNPDLRE